jgi:mannosyltransferase
VSTARAAIARRVDPALAALIVLALVLALYRLGAKGLWTDEAFSAGYARLGLAQLWHVLDGRDPNMGLYYVLLHFWCLAFGTGATAVRSLSVVFGVLSIPFAVELGTRLFGRASGLFAGLLLALGPFFVHYEQTARAYSLLVLLVLASCLAFVAALQRPARGSLLAYVLASALSIYAHYFAALVLLVQFATLAVLARRRTLDRRWLLAVLAVLALCVPAVVFAARAGAQGVEWIGEPTLDDLVGLPAGLAGGTALAALVSAMACLGFARALADGRRWQASFVAAWLLVPVAVDFVASRLGRPLFVAHYLIVVLPALLLLAGAGFAALPRRVPALAAGVLFVILAAARIGSWYGAPSIEGYRGAARYVTAAARGGDRVVYYPEWPLGGPTAGFAYYDSRPAAGAGAVPLRVRLDDAVRSRAPRLWLIFRDSDVPPAERLRVERRLAHGYVALRRETRFRNLTVILYGRAAAPARLA